MGEVGEDDASEEDLLLLPDRDDEEEEEEEKVPDSFCKRLKDDYHDFGMSVATLAPENKKKAAESKQKPSGKDNQSMVSELEGFCLLYVVLENACQHPGFFKGMCFICGKILNDVPGVALGYIHKELKLTSGYLSQRRNVESTSLLRHKKLYLVLDLDLTLLNSTALTNITSESHIDSLPGILKDSLFRVEKVGMMTKLRPFIHTFLQEASKLFEMYIYTMGDRNYAEAMAKLLDPRGSYFHSKIISRDNCTEKNQKGLDVILGTENAVLILDDTESVWQKDKDNLILMKRYNFFDSSCKDLKSLWMLKYDQIEADGALANVLGVLKKIHGKFFDLEHGDDLATRDVRQILKEIRKEVLKNCSLLFSGLKAKDKGRLRKWAQEMGAACTKRLKSSVTHVVSGNAGTQKSRWAVENGKFLVGPGWVKDAYYMWSRQLEDHFPVHR